MVTNCHCGLASPRMLLTVIPFSCAIAGLFLQLSRYAAGFQVPPVLYAKFAWR